MLITAGQTYEKSELKAIDVLLEQMFASFSSMLSKYYVKLVCRVSY